MCLKRREQLGNGMECKDSMCCVTLGQHFISVVCDIKVAHKEVVSCPSLEQGAQGSTGTEPGHQQRPKPEEKSFYKEWRENVGVIKKLIIIFS